MRRWVCIAFVLTAVIAPAQKLTRIDTIGAHSATGIYSRRITGDSLATGFCIVIHSEVKPHRHVSHSEHVVVIEGEGVMRLRDSVFRIGAGDVIFIPKNTVHSATRKGERPLKVLSIQSPGFDGKDRVWEGN